MLIRRKNQGGARRPPPLLPPAGESKPRSVAGRVLEPAAWRALAQIRAPPPTGPPTARERGMGEGSLRFRLCRTPAEWQDASTRMEGAQFKIDNQNGDLGWGDAIQMTKLHRIYGSEQLEEPENGLC